MGAIKNLINNIGLFLFIGAVPSLCWAGGLFLPFSWASFFLLLTGILCLLWFKTRTSSVILRSLLLTREEEWALCEGDQIIDRSPHFPVDSLSTFKAFLHPDSFFKLETALAELFHDKVPFQLRVHPRDGHFIYTLEGDSLEGKFILWFKNVTEIIHKERLHIETLHKNETLITHLQKSMDLLPIIIWSRNENQKITYCNRAYTHAVQSSPTLVCEEDIELIQSRPAKALARRALNTLEIQVLESTAVANEERRIFRIYETPDSCTQGTLGAAYDITELNEARSEIKNLIASHNKVLDHLSTAIAVYGEDGTLSYYNQVYVNLHNFDEDFLKIPPRLDEVLEDLRSRRQLPEYTDFPAYKKQRMQQLKEQLEPQEELMHLPDERTLRIFSAPHPMGGLLFMFEDVTDYLALERTNRTLLDAYQTTLDNLFEGVIVIGSDNRLKIFNPSFLRLWNFDEGEIQLDQHLTHIVEKLKDFFEYEGDWEPYKANIIQNLTDRVAKTGQLIRKDGVVINFGYVPLPNGDHLLSYTDATDTFRVQQALQEKNEALDTADRLKSEFIANVSSELRSPLNTIIGFTEILSHQYFGELNERQVDYVNGVLESSGKLLYLVNDILDLASLEAGYLRIQLKPAHIPTLIQGVIELISKRAETMGQHIITLCDKDIHEWDVDEKRLKQALFNLLSNASKFTLPGGKITVEAKMIENELELSVTDTGVGITVEDQARILEKFERGPGDSGAGLGLSLVKSLIELHGGRIELVSEPNKGTTVRCFIPKVLDLIESEKGEKNTKVTF
jgi:signal transduction histidine kinase